mmetsp:Transcript_7179/g.24844  ORF Transcript_7179/g.24844 Transcript_7179/m.24844 type:complete len:345 (+) Transcript_7179:87-1121(+)
MVVLTLTRDDISHRHHADPTEVPGRHHGLERDPAVRAGVVHLHHVQALLHGRPRGGVPPGRPQDVPLEVHTLRPAKHVQLPPEVCGAAAKLGIEHGRRAGPAPRAGVVGLHAFQAVGCVGSPVPVRILPRSSAHVHPPLHHPRRAALPNLLHGRSSDPNVLPRVVALHAIEAPRLKARDAPGHVKLIPEHGRSAVVPDPCHFRRPAPRGRVGVVHDRRVAAHGVHLPPLQEGAPRHDDAVPHDPARLRAPLLGHVGDGVPGARGGVVRGARTHYVLLLTPAPAGVELALIPHAREPIALGGHLPEGVPPPLAVTVQGIEDLHGVEERVLAEIPVEVREGPPRST